jgi:type IV pilus assembly protein PilV
MKQRVSADLRRVRGFTMLEVLISIVVIAFGMLGVAGLQAFALKNSQGASLRSIATVLSTDLIDRMKANAKGVDAGNYANGATPGAAIKIDSCVTAAGCLNPADMASHDLFEWQALIASSLPNGQGIVCRDSSLSESGATPASPKCDGTGPLVIKIWWIDDRNASNKNRERSLFVTEFER